MKNNNILKKSLNGFTLGVTIGVFISIFINFFFKTNYFSIATPYLINKFSSNIATLLCILAYGFIGVVSSLSNIVFFKEDISLIKATIIHFLLVQISLIIFGYLFAWLSYYFILVLPISFVIYMIFWLINFLYYKKQISSLNSKVL